METSYQRWCKSGRPRPYRHEVISGVGFDLAGALALFLFVVVISAWLFSARGIVSGLYRFAAGGFAPALQATLEVQVSSPTPQLEYYSSIYVSAGSSPDCRYVFVDENWYECSGQIPLPDGLHYVLIRRD